MLRTQPNLSGCYQPIGMLKRCLGWQLDVTMATAIKVRLDTIRGKWRFGPRKATRESRRAWLFWVFLWKHRQTNNSSEHTSPSHVDLLYNHRASHIIQKSTMKLQWHRIFVSGSQINKDKPLKLESTSYYSKVSLDLGLNPISVQAHKGRM